ncbi:MAG: metallophosphoesterase family protein [Bacteroidales bacterium]|nr:metallophosphoesterase family protein [Bacteroidales bacterium]
MIIVALTDLHGRTGIIKALSPRLRSADLVILCGDITHFGHRNEIASIVDSFRKINPNIVAVSGNCDYPEAERYLAAEGISLSGTVKEINDFCFFGLGGSLPCPGRTPNEYSEEEYEAILSGFTLPSGKPCIMVSHQPPFDSMNDTVSPGVHVGSRIIRRFIETNSPLICFTGHIHEGTGIDHIGETAVVNPGPAFAGGYAQAEIEGTSVKALSVLNFKDSSR